MTGTAVGPKTALVVVILGMAGVAILRGGFQVCQDTCVEVTTDANSLGMLPDK